jgi:1-phosphofructokinase family hexose kinase
MIVCLAANPSIDKLFLVERIFIGAIHRPTDFAQVAGGKGLNVARAAAALGGDVRVASLLGGHAGRWIEDALAAEGIAGRFAWTEAETRSCLSVADTAGNLTEFYEAGNAIASAAWDRLRALVEDTLPGAGWLILSGSLPPGAPPRGYRDLIEAAHREGVAVALDTRGESLAMAVVAGPEIVKVNAAETEELLGLPVTNDNESVLAAKELRAQAGADVAIVTRGQDGAVAALEHSCWRGRVKERGRYPVGSGDAFLAGLVTALDRDKEWPEAFALALGAGAANAEVEGAGRLLRERSEVIAAAAEVVQLGRSTDV